MKIRNIKIKGLYDIYDYDLDFFEDVTFLHGINGSGKTTILEIISNIISGNLSYLLKYLFEEIVLSYTNKNGYEETIATVYKGNIIKNLIMDCQSYTKYRPNETTGGIFVSWRRKEELPTGAWLKSWAPFFTPKNRR